jgi:hypothetical protein
MNFFFHLFGIHVDRAAKVTNWSLVLHGGLGNELAVLIAVALGVWTWWSYRQGDDGLARWRRVTLIALRVAFLLLALLILLRPALSVTMENQVRRTLLLLFDATASMSIRDLQQTSRVEHVQAILRDPKLKLLDRLGKDYDLAPFAFGRETTELTATNWLSQLAATNNATALGDAIEEVISRKRGQPIAGMFVVTDGANNLGAPPLAAAATAQQEGLPLFIYGVGEKTPRDVAVSGLFAPELVFLNDEVPVVIRYRGQAVAGRSARLSLTLGNQRMDAVPVAFTNDTEQTVTMKFTPREKGSLDLVAAIPPFDDELVKDNNTRSQRIRVLDTKIKVLLVEQSPRWEFRYLQASLLRDRRVELKCVLVEGDPGIANGADSPHLEEFPRAKEDLFKYDLVIFGDVDLRMLKPEQIENLNLFVSDFGGALLLVAGKRFNPSSYRGTVLEKMLPVELDPALAEGGGDSSSAPVQLELTADGKASPMMRLSDDENENQVRWRALPPVYWTARVGRSKPGAEVLLVDSDGAKATRFGNMPVLATQQYGSGRTLFLGTDNTWRWRRNAGEIYFTTFWSQMVQRLALLRLLGAQKKIQLSANRQSYHTGQRVTIFARVYSQSYEPVKDPTLRGYYAGRNIAGTETPPVEVQLRILPEQPGMFRAEFVAPPSAGKYKFYLERDPQTQLEFDVAELRAEFTDIAMNEPLLKEMATATRGQFLSQADLAKLPEIIGNKSERVSSTVETELWSSPFFFLLMLLVLSAEWILRKLSQLK